MIVAKQQALIQLENHVICYSCSIQAIQGKIQLRL